MKELDELKAENEKLTKERDALQSMLKDAAKLIHHWVKETTFWNQLYVVERNLRESYEKIAQAE
jgi:hypothetical protein